MKRESYDIHRNGMQSVTCECNKPLVTALTYIGMVCNELPMSAMNCFESSEILNEILTRNS